MEGAHFLWTFVERMLASMGYMFNTVVELAMNCRT